jgi:hypothetical protein
MGKFLKLLLIPAGIAFYVRLVTKYVFDFIRGFNVGRAEAIGSSSETITSQVEQINLIFTYIDSGIFNLWVVCNAVLLALWFLKVKGKIEGKFIDKILD